MVWHEKFTKNRDSLVGEENQKALTEQQFKYEYSKKVVADSLRMEEEKKTTLEDIKEVFAEAKGSGFDAATMREILKMRKKDAADLEEAEYLLDTYKRALGMIPEVD